MIINHKTTPQDVLRKLQFNDQLIPYVDFSNITEVTIRKGEAEHLYVDVQIGEPSKNDLRKFIFGHQGWRQVIPAAHPSGITDGD